MIPELVKKPNFEEVVDRAREYLDFVGSEKYNDDELDEYKQFVFEATMMAVFGKNIFDWIDERT